MTIKSHKYFLNILYRNDKKILLPNNIYYLKQNIPDYDMQAQPIIIENNEEKNKNYDILENNLLAQQKLLLLLNQI